ncbi:hypothetical protein Gorai_004389 [Gossypium raimondii]|uniref:NADH dehydrogenase [ubiquinone] 1 alpha subcomplex assembly factor 3 n=1 Tax=Gossypium raimondii TaxID=29730 RepID=A0A7J8QIT1_GOSRA|nr:hypothetical protein [Gossypium raimondii]
MAVRGRAVETLPKLMRSLRKDSASSTVTRTPALPSLRRAFSLYDQINLIDNVPDDQLRFQRFFLFSPSLIYTETGFTVNGVNYEGSLLCVGNLVTSWGPRKFSEITPQSLSIFQIIRPIPGETSNNIYIILLAFSIPVVSPPVVPGESKEAENNFLMHISLLFILEILILGCGRYIEPVDPELRRFIRSTGMKLEALDSRNAASTYNILNEEGRIVAAALLPYGVSS